MATKLGSLFGSSTTAVAGASAGAAVIVAAAVGVTVWRNSQAPEGVTPPETVVETPAETVAALPEDPAPAVELPEVAAPVPPRFDVVRVDAEGAAVIAGFAMAEADVTLILDGDPIEVARADAGGNFVALLSLVPSDDPRVLSLEAALEGGDVIAGEETVIIAPFGPVEAVAEGEAPEPPPAVRVDTPGIAETSDTPEVEADTDTAVALATDVAPADPGQDTPPAPSTEPAEPVTQAAVEPEPEPTPTAEPEAPTVVIAGAEGVRVLQGPSTAPEAQTEVQLDAISYDLAGDVTLAGRGPAETGLRVTLNNQPIQLGEIGPGGAWSLDLPDVDPGTYTLRVEQLASDGSVASDVETPFLREDPDRIASNPMLVEAGASVITVQPDFTLWGIAQANFGDGVLYLQIFNENRDQIRDPDMIFPGQIFRLPDLPRAAQDEG